MGYASKPREKQKQKEDESVKTLAVNGSKVRMDGIDQKYFTISKDRKGIEINYGLYSFPRIEPYTDITISLRNKTLEITYDKSKDRKTIEIRDADRLSSNDTIQCGYKDGNVRLKMPSCTAGITIAEKGDSKYGNVMGDYYSFKPAPGSTDLLFYADNRDILHIYGNFAPGTKMRARPGGGLTLVNKEEPEFFNPKKSIREKQANTEKEGVEFFANQVKGDSKSNFEVEMFSGGSVSYGINPNKKQRKEDPLTAFKSEVKDAKQRIYSLPRSAFDERGKDLSQELVDETGKWFEGNVIRDRKTGERFIHMPEDPAFVYTQDIGGRGAKKKVIYNSVWFRELDKDNEYAIPYGTGFILNPEDKSVLRDYVNKNDILVAANASQGESRSESAVPVPTNKIIVGKGKPKRSVALLDERNRKK